MCPPMGLLELAEETTVFIFSIVGVFSFYGWMRGDIGWKHPETK